MSKASPTVSQLQLSQHLGPDNSLGGAGVVLCIVGWLAAFWTLPVSSTPTPSFHNQKCLQIWPRGHVHFLGPMRIMGEGTILGVEAGRGKQKQFIPQSSCLLGTSHSFIISLDTGILWAGYPHFHFTGERVM